MSSCKMILALWLGASAWAQTLPQKPQVNPPVTAKPNPARTSSVAPSRSTPIPVVKPARAGTPKAKANSGRKKSSNVPTTRTAIAAGGNPTAAKGHRDPFVSPVVERTGNAVTCTGSNRRCLAVGDISLHGVVRCPGGFIAVVMNGEHTYFLRENDPLANGEVERITRDTIVLRERSSDALGRPLMHEVTKKIGVPSV
jgi:hypothetical protein